MRAYPANAKNSSPAACSTPATVTSSPITGRQPSASPKPTMMTTTAVSTDSTTATITRVSSAERWTPA